MMVVQKQFATLLLLVSLAGAQTAGVVSLQGVQVTHAGKDVRIEITLDAPVKASVITAVHPDRLVLELPNTTLSEQQHIPVYFDGVRVVRYALHQMSPAVTRVVVELDQPQPYTLETNGTHLVLTVSPALDARANSHRDGAPAAAASGGFIGVFRRKQGSVPQAPADENAQIPAAPPSGPALRFPPDQSVSASSSTSAGNSQPSAAHPSMGSLQQGTVFPGTGTPGAGTVPGTTGGAPGSFDAAVSAQAAAKKSAPSGLALPATAAANPSPSSLPTPSLPQDSSRSVAGNQPGSTAAAVPPSPPNLHPLGSAGQAAAVKGVDPTVQPPAQVQAASVTPPAPSSPPSVAPVSSPSVEVHPGSSTESASQVPPPTPPEPAGQTVATYAAAVANLKPVPVETAEPSVAGDSTEASAGTSPPAPTATEPAGQTVATYNAAIADLKPVPLHPETPEPSAADLEMEALRAANPNLRTVFKVKYVADGVAYLDGGRSDGLVEGMKLEIKDGDMSPRPGQVVDPADPRVVAELVVNALADTSSVTDIHTPKRTVKPGDLAYLSMADAQALVNQQTLSATRKYPAVVTFTEGDPLEEEARAEVPKPPPPSMNRARGRIGLDYFSTVSHGASSITSSDLGMVVRTDITRLNGTYWNISGYWRGSFTATTASQPQTLQSLINRTYHLSMTYDNPNSSFVAGFGRLYLPYAPSLDTIDGGYVGYRMGHGATMGVFAGSTPDPSSYSYNPNQEIAGTFINFEGGSYDAWKYSSTSGVGMSAINFAVQKPFLFFENSVFYKRFFSIYDSLQADNPVGNVAVPSPGPGIGRNFLTVRIQPHPRLELDFNENYFRDLPTFDPTLIGTGLLDKYLFQGFSAGGRLEVLKGIFVYTDLGSSGRSGDAKTSLNEAYGLTFNRLPKLGVRTDFHYSRFTSSFGSGSYESVSVSRNLTEALQLEVLAGQQNFTSSLTSIGRSRFVNANLETALGRHYFVQGGLGFNRGDLSYDQWHFTLGYRFDTKTSGK